MRVAYLINQYPGLSHSFVRREIQALERLGVTVHRYAVRPASQGALAPEDEAEAARTRTILTTPAPTLARAILGAGARRPGRAVRALGQALRLSRRSEAGLVRHLIYWAEALVVADWLKRDGARHVHAHFGTNSATVAMMAARVAGLRFSMTVHGPEEFDKPRMIGLPEKIERAAFTAGVSSYGVSQLRRLVAPEHWERIVEVRCGVEPDFYEGASTDDTADAGEGADFVCVGRLCEQKGQLTLIEAAGALHREGRDFRLDLVGDGEMRGLIEAAIERLDLGGHVRLLGWRAPSQVRAALAGARCFVLPSYAEGLPVSIMEAFTLRVPVISTYVAGIPELVRDGENGWLVPAADADALANAMRSALDQTADDRTEMASHGYAMTLRRHRIDEQVVNLTLISRPSLTGGRGGAASGLGSAGTGHHPWFFSSASPPYQQSWPLCWRCGFSRKSRRVSGGASARPFRIGTAAWPSSFQRMTRRTGSARLCGA